MMSVMIYFGLGSDGKGADEETPFMVLVLVGAAAVGAGGGAAGDEAGGMIWFGAGGVWAVVAAACAPTIVGGSGWVTIM